MLNIIPSAENLYSFSFSSRIVFYTHPGEKGKKFPSIYSFILFRSSAEKPFMSRIICIRKMLRNFPSWLSF